MSRENFEAAIGLCTLYSLEWDDREGDYIDPKTAAAYWGWLAAKYDTAQKIGTFNCPHCERNFVHQHIVDKKGFVHTTILQENPR